MDALPKWYKPVAVVAILWNALGCFAYLSDVRLTAEDIAAMSPQLQALYASRTAWAVSATAIAVWAGLLGSLGLFLQKRWANPLFIASLLGVIVQDIGLFVLSDAAAIAGPSAYGLQGFVLLVAIGLAVLGRRAARQGWLA